jgi:hypothetical protein
MGTACTRVIERVAAATGEITQAESSFETMTDVEMGGLLFMLPSLIQNGLFKYSHRYFELPPGFYGIIHLFTLFAFMILGRLKSIERLRYVSQGEWGKLLGLDRIPEVRTLRNKLKFLADNNESVKKWALALSRDWMEDEPSASGIVYVDGHVRVYHGKQTRLPKRYVARCKLSLRGIVDYWVNDSIGRPFFSISTPFTDGLLKTLKEDIVPRLLSDIPNQPSSLDLKDDKYLSRFVLVFDREGYSPDFFKQMWKKRVACQTYRKYAKELWISTEFQSYEVTLNNGEKITMDLAERGTFLGDKLWVREIRKKGKRGHQTSIVSTDFKSSISQIAIQMFARWSQENFFKYMLENFGLDALSGYSLSCVDETKLVVNPVYRRIEGEIKSLAAKLVRKKAKFHDIQLTEPMPTPKTMKAFACKKAELLEEIESMSVDVEDLKRKRKVTNKHVPYRDLAEAEKFKIISPHRKQFVDIIKMIAYRAETSVSLMLKEYLSRRDDARPLVKGICQSSVDILPDNENKILNIKLHNMPTKGTNYIVTKLCEELNNSETKYPGTDYTMCFGLVSN